MPGCQDAADSAVKMLTKAMQDLVPDDGSTDRIIVKADGTSYRYSG